MASPPDPTPPAFDEEHPSSRSHAVRVGEGAQVDQLAVGSHIQQVKYIGYSVEQVQVLLKEIGKSYTRKPFDGLSPYVGLAAFQERDADHFFGREKLTQQLVARVLGSRFVVIAGPSGSGKSSLARAGLIPALKRGALPGSDHWLYEILSPGRRPLAELGRVVDNLKDLAAGDDLRQRGRTDATRLSRWLEAALGGERQRRVVLLVDQFEEAFTQVADEAERAAFFNLLLYAATLEDGRVAIVCATRSDFIGNWAVYPNLNANLSEGVNQIGPMQPYELVSAIARPAIQVGLAIDPDLVKQVLDDMRDAPGALPLMQFALQDLFEYSKSKGRLSALTRNDYLERGGLQKALARHADAEFAKLGAEEQQIARGVFARLVVPGRGTEDTKRNALFEELVPVGLDPGQVQNVIARLEDARLITTEVQDSQEKVTLTHEQLIKAWPWLQRLVDENREGIALQNQIEQDAQEWVASQGEASYLYTGARLATSREQLAAKKIILSTLAQGFVNASITALAAEQRARQRRLQFAIGGLIAALLMISAFALFAFQQRNTAITETNARATSEAAALNEKSHAEEQARISESRRLAALSNLVRNQDVDTARLLGVEAFKLDENYEARNNLFTVLNTPLVTSLRGPTGAARYVALSPDGKILASSGCGKRNANDLCVSGEIRLWDAVSGRQVGEPLTEDAAEVARLAFSPNSAILASESCTKSNESHFCVEAEIRLWDVASGKPHGEPLRGHTSFVSSLAFSPDGKTLASGSFDNTIRLWDVVSGQQIGAPLTGHTYWVVSIAFSPDGKTLASGALDDTIRLWEVPSGKPLRAPLIEKADGPNCLAFSPDGKTLASGSHEGTIRLWDVERGEQIGEPFRGHGDWVTSVAFSPDGRTLASGSNDKTVRLWDIAGGKPIGVPLTAHTDSVISVAFRPDGKTLASAGADRTIRLWDIASARAGVAPLTGHTDFVWSVVFSPDGKSLASSSSDFTIRLWDSASGLPSEVPLTGHTWIIWSVAFSPDGKMLASGGCAKSDDPKCPDGEIRLWDVARGKQIGEPLHGRTGIVRSVTFSPDGKILASGNGDKTIGLWDPASGKQVRESLDGHTAAVTSVAFSPDGKTLASGSEDKTIRLWDPASGEQIGEALTAHTAAVTSIAFSPDGKLLASGSEDKTIRLWDIVKRSQIGAPLTGNEDGVLSVAFSPDGKMLASGNRDQTIRLWDTASGQPLGAPLMGHTDYVMSVAFSPDGKTLASGSADKTVRLWEVDQESSLWPARACRLVNRNLTRDEWAQYFDRDPSTYDLVYAKNPTCPDLRVEPPPAAGPTR